MNPSLALAVVDSLRDQIIAGAILPGEKLPSESALMERFSVSRTVIREAISRLQAEGLVQTRRGAGSYALLPPAAATPRQAPDVPRTPEHRRHLLSFRTAIESEAASLAARSAVAEAMSAIRRTQRAFERAVGDPSASIQADFAFHQAVAEASANPYILDAIHDLGPAMVVTPAQRLATAAEAPATAVLEHQSIVALIEAGDALGAAAAMRAHLASSWQRLG
jgi:GntR family transcriptional repressor for pyruvate dehydrogenase complex